MSKELMIDRWIVIADYPGNPNKVGDVLCRTLDTEYCHSEMGVSLSVGVVGRYPAIFRKLKWWEKIDVKKRCPTHLKRIENGKVYKVQFFNVHDGKAFDVNMKFLNLNKCLPATQLDY